MIWYSVISYLSFVQEASVCAQQNLVHQLYQTKYVVLPSDGSKSLQATATSPDCSRGNQKITASLEPKELSYLTLLAYDALEDLLDCIIQNF